MADTPSPLSLDAGPLSTGERFKPSGWAEEGDLDPYAPAEKAHRTAAKKEEAFAKRFEERRAKEEAESERAYAGAERAAAQPRPAVPQMERVESPPKPEDYQKMSMGYLGAMVLLGAFGGKFIRNAANAPLAAFNGALRGWQEGNLEAYQQKSAEWKEKQQQVLDNNRARLDEYRTILEDRDASIQDQMLRVKLTAAKHQDKMMYDRADAENWTGVAQAYDRGVAVHEKAQAATDKLVEQQTQMNETAVERANQWKAYLATPQGQQALAQLDRQSPGAAFRINAFVKQVADPTPTPAPMAAQQVGPEGTEGPPPALSAATAGMPAELRGPVPLNMKPADMAARQFRIESYQAGKGEPSSADWAAFHREQNQSRSLSGLLAQKYMADHPDATYEEAAEAAAEQAGRMAGQRTGGTMAMRVEAATNEVAIALPQALEASRALPRGRVVPFNELLQKWERGTSDPRYNDFMVANVTLLNAYVRAMNPQGIPRIAERMEAHAIGLLSTATSPQAYEVQLRRLWREVQGSRKAVAQTRRGEEGATEFPEPNAGPVRVNTPEEAAKLKPGTHYINPQGDELIR